jgi:hypothetical protein
MDKPKWRQEDKSCKDELPKDKPFLLIEGKLTTRKGYDLYFAYSLYLHVGKFDIRVQKHFGGTFRRVHLGGTYVSSSSRSDFYKWEGDDLRTPFRNGAHLKWDAEELRLPAFVKIEDDIQKIYDPEEVKNG